MAAGGINVSSKCMPESVANATKLFQIRMAGSKFWGTFPEQFLESIQAGAPVPDGAGIDL
jgi:hypothetical protein